MDRLTLNCYLAMICVAVFLPFARCTDSNGTQCSKSFIYIPVNESDLSWSSAENLCKNRSYEVASIHSREENDLILKNVLPENHTALIGLTYNCSSNATERICWSDGSVLDFQNCHPDSCENETRNSFEEHECFAIVNVNDTESLMTIGQWIKVNCTEGVNISSTVNGVICATRIGKRQVSSSDNVTIYGECACVLFFSEPSCQNSTNTSTEDSASTNSSTPAATSQASLTNTSSATTVSFPVVTSSSASNATTISNSTSTTNSITASPTAYSTTSTTSTTTSTANTTKPSTVGQPVHSHAARLDEILKGIFIPLALIAIICLGCFAWRRLKQHKFKQPWQRMHYNNINGYEYSVTFENPAYNLDPTVT